MIQDTISFLPHVLDIHLYLLQSLEKLVEQQIVHNDIQEKHILFSFDLELPILTHFTEALTFEEFIKIDETKTAPETWDNYQLSICLLSCLENQLEKETLNTDKLKLEKYKDILKTNINHIPEKRETLQMTRSQILKI